MYSRKVAGWAFGLRMTADLVISALNMALLTRKPESVIHHAIQGSQYTSIDFGKRFQEMGVRPSMGTTVVDAYDNAMAEGFLATLECELIDRRLWKTHTEARHDIFTWIETWHNPHRRHSKLGQMSPIKFERKQLAQAIQLPQQALHGLPTTARDDVRYLGRSSRAAVDNPESISPTDSIDEVDDLMQIIPEVKSPQTVL